jgi:hypothetical protein
MKNLNNYMFQDKSSITQIYKHIKSTCFITSNTTNFIRLYAKNYDTKLFKTEGRIKHFPHATKEWKDSAYTYNKNNLRSLPVKHNLINKLIKDHFYLSNLTSIARSHRMRTLIRKSTTNKIFISDPQIKHNNDKIIVTVYTYNREKQSFIRDLLFYDRKLPLYMSWLNKYKKTMSFNKLWVINKERKDFFSSLVRKRKFMFKKKSRSVLKKKRRLK